MKRIAMLVVVAVLIGGCVHTPEPAVPTRSEILRALDTGQTVFNLCAGWAIVRGVDPATVADIQIKGNAAFRLAREAVQVDVGGDLVLALGHVRAAVDEAFTLAESAGVNPATVALLRERADELYIVIDAVLVARG